MITGIQIQNFKCFEDIKLDGIDLHTLLIGKNSAGKSSVLQALLLIKESMYKNNALWKGDNYDLLNRNTAVYKHEDKRPIIITVRFKPTGDEILRLKPFISKIKSFSVQYVIGTEPTLNQEHGFLNEKPVYSRFYKEKQGYFDLRERIDKPLSQSNHVRLNFGGNRWQPLFWPWTLDAETIKPEWKETAMLTGLLIDILKWRFINIYFLSSDRKISQWNYPPQDEPKNMGPLGETAALKMHYLHSNVDAIYYEIEEWIKKIDPNIKEVRSPMRRGNVEIELNDLGTMINLLMSGYGLNKSIPIIIQTLISPPGSTIMVEEPETNLHRIGVQSLIDLFIQETEDNSKQFIFTTHSLDLLMLYHKLEKNKGLKFAQRIDIKQDGDKRVAENSLLSHDFHTVFQETLKILTE